VEGRAYFKLSTTIGQIALDAIIFYVKIVNFQQKIIKKKYLAE